MLTQRQSPVSNPSPPRQSKVKTSHIKPPLFTGYDDNVHTWIHEVREYFEMLDYTPRDMAKMLPSNLQGLAHAYSHSLPTVNKDNAKLTI